MSTTIPKLCKEISNRIPQPKPLHCVALDFAYGTGENNKLCGNAAEHLCGYCGDGVCIRCTLPCYECGVHLHDGMCRDDHAKETGHSIDVPKYSQASELDADQYDAEFRQGQLLLAALLDRKIERIVAIVEDRLRSAWRSE